MASAQKITQFTLETENGNERRHITDQILHLMLYKKVNLMQSYFLKI